jgi:hypothetical protein
MRFTLTGWDAMAIGPFLSQMVLKVQKYQKDCLRKAVTSRDKISLNLPSRPIFFFLKLREDIYIIYLHKGETAIRSIFGQYMLNTIWVGYG